MKDLFTGSLGHLDNHGGSPMFTTPNTIYVPPEYEIETDVPSVAEFVTCTLDGRLWVWKRSRRYYVAVFRWNEETERLEFVSTTILSGETVQKRGVDWILTDKSLLRSQAEVPYISRSEYDSDDTTYSDAIEKCYSFWPELETWQEITAQKLNIEDSPDDKWKEVPQNLITPLEFHYYSDDDIQAVTEFNPKLCYCNGQLYAKGKAHIGRAYLLPRVFNTDGEVIGFYLYILPDYMREYDSENQTFNDNDGWDKLNIAPLEDNSVGIFTPEDNNNTACKKAEDGLVYRLPQSEQLDYSVDNGTISFDGFTGLNLALNSQGASFLRDNVSYQCKGLQQWFAPSNKIEAIFHQQSVISSIENATIAIHTQQGFYRELLPKKLSQISTATYSGKNLLFNVLNSNSKKIVQANSIYNTNIISASIWEKVFQENPYKFTVFPLIDDKNFALSIGSFTNPYFYDDGVDCVYWLEPYPLSCYIQEFGKEYYRKYTEISYANAMLHGPFFNEYFKDHPEWFGFSEGFEINANDIIFQSKYINPETQEFIISDYKVNLSKYISCFFNGFCARDGKGGILLERDKGGSEIFVPVFDIPEAIIHWQSIGNGLLLNDIISLFDLVTGRYNGDIGKLDVVYYDNKRESYGLFKEPFTSALFIVEPSLNFKLAYDAFSDRKILEVNTFFDTTSQKDGIFTSALHYAQTYRDITMYRSEYHPEIFDFQAELERSKLT